MSYRGHRDWLRCNNCRTRRGTRTQLFMHLMAHPECAPCTCGGYHYAHRRGTTYCDHNPNAFPNQASRAGATDEEVAEIKRRMAEEAACPF